jgi:hypothetical protein
MIYIVTEEAVYRHRILGVFDSQEKAEARALEVALQEDGHHEYRVSTAELNTGIDDVVELVNFRRERIGHGWPRKYTDPKRHIAPPSTRNS